jgi:hypothetical protein
LFHLLCTTTAIRFLVSWKLSSVSINIAVTRLRLVSARGLWSVKLLLVFASTVILRSGSRGTHHSGSPATAAG